MCSSDLHDVRNHSVRRRYAHAGCECNPRVRQVRPRLAAFEKNRLSLYREAAKEAEEIFDRWADEIDDLDEDFMEDEDYEPDEYYSD